MLKILLFRLITISALSLLLIGAAVSTSEAATVEEAGVRITKEVNPTDLCQSNQFTVTVRVEGVGRAGIVSADVMLVLDRSLSMSGEKLQDAKDAAKQFVDRMNLTQDQVGVVSFSDTATLNQPLTSNPAAAKAAIDALVSGGLTAIGEGIKLARDELLGPNHRATNSPVMILLSDGLNTAGAEPRTPAFAAKAAGIRIITIGLGSGADEAALTSMASSEADYHSAPDSSALAGIYASIAQILRSLVATNVVLIDGIPGPVRYIDGSATIPPQIVDKTLTWRIGDLGAGQAWNVSWRQVMTVAGLVDEVNSRLNFNDVQQRLHSVGLPQIRISDCAPGQPTTTTTAIIPAAAAVAAAGPSISPAREEAPAKALPPTGENLIPYFIIGSLVILSGIILRRFGR